MTFKDFVGTGSSTGTGSTGGLIGLMTEVVVPVIFTLAAASFVWGVVNYFLIHGGEEAKRKEGRQFMLWGVIGLAVLFSVWTFVNLLLNTLGIAPSA